MLRRKECVGECPKCGSFDIEYGSNKLFENDIWYKAVCEECWCEFTERYDLVFSETTYEEENKEEQLDNGAS